MSRFACDQPACAHEFSEAGRALDTLCPLCGSDAYRVEMTIAQVSRRLSLLIRRLEAEDGPLVGGAA